MLIVAKTLDFIFVFRGNFGTSCVWMLGNCDSIERRGNGKSLETKMIDLSVIKSSVLELGKSK